jgi:hypothetical protein
MESAVISMSDIVEFVPNVVQSLAFKYARPKIVQARSGERAMFSCVDGRVAFWDAAVAEPGHERLERLDS